jgi:hypothetical protein
LASATNEPVEDCGLSFVLLAAVYFAGLPLPAKTVVDFNPNVDFSKYKAFAFIGGVENLLMFEVNPGLGDDRVHCAVTRELTQKGLKEVQPGRNADLMAFLGKSLAASECDHHGKLGTVRRRWVLGADVR